MNCRERLQAALDHCTPDRVPVDFGATAVTGMHAAAVTRLRRAMLGDPSHRVKVVEPYQMLGEIDEPLRAALGIDVVGVPGRQTLFGFENADWKPFTLFDGTEVLVPGEFNVKTEENSGDLLIYPEGDRSVGPSGRMPRGGAFFDAIVRQEPLDEDRLDPADNCREFSLLSDEDLSYYRDQARRLDDHPDVGTVLSIPGAAFGDIALVPGPWMKQTPGIREVEEWYVSTVARRDYVLKVFQTQCDIALQNIAQLIEIFGDRVQVAFVTGTDFGTQRGPFIAPQTYRELYKPFHRRLNDLIHSRTGWKTFIHSCGSVYALIPDFIEAGFDVLNPVQCSAVEMDAARLKREFGRDLVFWGGGVNTQQTLAFGTPEAVYREVRERIDIFNDAGGFVFDAIHNVQAPTPTENLLALFHALRDSAA